MIYTVEFVSTSTFQKYIHFPKRLLALREYSLLDFYITETHVKIADTIVLCKLNVLSFRK
jgi:hypothetical protein